MSNLNKKGNIAGTEMGDLIIGVAGALIALGIVLAIIAFISPTASNMGCGLNIRVRAAATSASGGYVGSPVLMCNQYRTPIDINAAKWSACPGIADFCKKASGELLVECWKQCARIQVDYLADSCWTMAGSGRLDLKDSYLENLVGTFTDPAKIVSFLVVGGVTYSAGRFMGLGSGLSGALGKFGAGVVILDFTLDKEAKILKCYRFRIVNPIIDPNTRESINYFDDSLGRSWAYSLACNQSALNASGCPLPINSKICKPSDENPMCSFGGTGVKYINENYNFGNLTYKFNDVEVRSLNLVDNETMKEEFEPATFFNYNITDPRNQVCYIAYYQGKDSSNKYVVRNCNSWSAYTGAASYLN